MTRCVEQLARGVDFVSNECREGRLEVSLWIPDPGENTKLHIRQNKL